MCGFKQNNCTELTCCFQETCMVHNLGTDHLTFCELCDVSADVTARFDSVFWCGDLNFRLERRRNAVEGKVTQMQDAASIPHFEELLGADQLSKYITEGQCFPLAMPHCPSVRQVHHRGSVLSPGYASLPLSKTSTPQRVSAFPWLCLIAPQ